METAARSEHLVRFKSFELNLRTRELHQNGRKVRLHGHPINVLAILLERPGELVSREELKKRLWSKDTFVDFEQILNNSIGKLREALGDRADEPRFIETLPRLGYRFIAPVEHGLDQRSELKSSNSDPAAPKDILTSSGNPVSSIPAATASSKLGLWIMATLNGLVILLAVASVMYIRTRRGVTSQQGEKQSALALQFQPVTNAPGSAIFPIFSPDEREIAFLWDGPERNHFNVYVLLLGSDTPLRLTESKDGILGAPVWSPDGREIAFSRCDGKNDGVYLVPALGGTERRLTHVGCPETEPGPLAWLSDGKELLMIDHCP